MSEPCDGPGLEAGRRRGQGDGCLFVYGCEDDDQDQEQMEVVVRKETYRKEDMESEEDESVRVCSGGNDVCCC